MRRVIMTLMVVLAFMASFGSRESAAQTAQSTSKFKVVRGTTLWDLAKKTTGGGGNWRSIFDANITAGILDSSKMSVRAGGDTVVYLQPGQTILLRADAAQRAPEVVTAADTAQAAARPVIEISSGSGKFGLLWYGLALILILVLAWALRRARSNNQENLSELATARRVADAERNYAERARILFESNVEELRTSQRLLEEARRPREAAETFSDLEVRGLATGYRRQRTDDEGEGPSFISGGITSPETLVLALQRAAQIEGVRRNPDAPITPHTNYVFRRGRRGMIVSGTYSSLFSDGTELVRVIELDKPETHRIVWKATTVAPDGTEFDVYAEEVCANGMAVPVNAQGDLVWWVMPAQMQTHALPAHAIFIDPPAAEEPATPEPAPVEMVSVVAVTTPDGQTIYLPAGSTMSPVQIPASEMISPEQGSETASS